MARSGPTTSLTLLEQIQRLDPGAWHTFVQVYYPLLYRWCRQAGLQEHDAADVVQEVLRAVASNVAKFRHERPQDSLRGWLRGITRHKLQDFWRVRQQAALARGGTTSMQELATISFDPDIDVADEHSEELQLLVHRALECIRREVHEQTWQAAYAVLMQGDSVADTATKLRMSPNAVYKAKTRVLRRLRETIGLWEIEHRPDDAVENNSQ